ncbi:LamG-like jellyroll fold domain-containing protein [Algoriphagus halophilus]|uniref:LamG-like jellyroll fold domain-containing protein n=1 Tax=Algoriphagus halophilus TaxID=226505 RepID=UPI00358EB1DD
MLVFFVSIFSVNAQDNTINLNGSSQYAEVAHNSSLNTTNFTVEAWALVTGGIGSFRAVVSNRNTDTQQGYVIYADNLNNWRVWVGTGGGFKS